jgi:hypothetical protein
LCHILLDYAPVSGYLSSTMLELPTTQSTHCLLKGPAGSLAVPADDEIIRKLAMLYEGECEGNGPLAAARKFGFSKQRYFQLRKILQQHGSSGLQSQKTGPKTAYRRTELVSQYVIRHRFLDPEASPDVIAQKIRQSGHSLSTRSVQRVLAEFGLQKKTLRPAAKTAQHSSPPNPTDRPGAAPGSRRPRKPPTGGATTAGR